ncbi:hypothetical protein MY8738_007014 [Beauveria namnaoensis]
MSPSVHLAPTTVVIIGAGFAGICMASTLQLRLSVYDYCIYDRNADIGGREILEYLDSVARHFGVHQHFTGSRDWTGSSWNDGDQEWTIELQDVTSGQRYIQRCQFLISCVGGLTNPRQVLLPGMDCFRGAILHTARWDHEVKFDDKRVVVIGNGASAAQLIPALAGTPSQITQVMRTPEYLIPSSDRTFSRVAQLLLRCMPGPWLVIRMLIFIYMEMTFLFFQKSKVGEIGRKISEQESLAHMRESTPKILVHLNAELSLRVQGRRIFNKAYTAALHRSDVDVVRGHVTQVQEFSVVLNQGQEIDADIIVFATGFETSQYDTPMQGSGGETRLNHWKKRGHKSTYKSVAMSGFPNMFFVLGPNSGRLHTSTLLSIEWHSEYITRVIKPIIIGNKGGTVQVRARDENIYQARLLEALKYTVHDASCSSILIDKETGTNWVSPIRNTFRYRLLLIGIPVGFRGKVGNLLSVDEPLKEVTKKKNRNEKDLFGAVRMSYSTIVTAWFSFDPIRYLHRGDDNRGLKYKLNQFLKNRGEDPAQWPYAYLVSVPRFLCWSRSVVSWWYLYAADRRLDAVIMEINNSFDEKRPVLFRAESDEGKLKFITRISFQETPIDASQAKWTQVVRLLLFWTMPGTLTTPRIIFQALHLHYYLAGMKMKDKPVVQPGTIPPGGRVLERVFRQWLEFSLLERSPLRDVEIQYIPSRSISNETFTLKPCSSEESLGPKLRQLKIEPVDPSFYRALAQRRTMREILMEAMEPCGCDADPMTRVLVVSDRELLLLLLEGLKEDDEKGHGSWRTAYALDHFVQSRGDSALASAYWAVTRRFRVADSMLVGSKWLP